LQKEVDDILCLWTNSKLTTTTKQTRKNKFLARTSPTTTPTWQLNILIEIKRLFFPNIFRRSHCKTNFWFWLNDFALICKMWWPYCTISLIAKLILHIFKIALRFHILYRHRRTFCYKTCFVHLLWLPQYTRASRNRVMLPE